MGYLGVVGEDLVVGFLVVLLVCVMLEAGVFVVVVGLVVSRMGFIIL